MDRVRYAAAGQRQGRTNHVHHPAMKCTINIFTATATFNCKPGSPASPAKTLCADAFVGAVRSLTSQVVSTVVDADADADAVYPA